MHTSSRNQLKLLQLKHSKKICTYCWSRRFQKVYFNFSSPVLLRVALLSVGSRIQTSRHYPSGKCLVQDIPFCFSGAERSHWLHFSHSLTTHDKFCQTDLTTHPGTCLSTRFCDSIQAKIELQKTTIISMSTLCSQGMCCHCYHTSPHKTAHHNYAQSWKDKSHRQINKDSQGLLPRISGMSTVKKEELNLQHEGVQ